MALKTDTTSWEACDPEHNRDCRSRFQIIPKPDGLAFQIKLPAADAA